MTTHASDYLEDALLDHITGQASYSPVATVYLALFTAFTEGGAQTEVTDANYDRQAISFAAASSRSIASNADITFDAADSGWTNSHFAIMDASTSGNVLYWGTLSITVGVGEQLRVSSGNLTVTHGAALDGISDYATNTWLDFCLRNQSFTISGRYLGLATAWTDDSTYTEAADGAYARQNLAGDIGAASGGAATNTVAQTFPAITGGGETYTHAFIIDTSSGAGNLLMRSALAASKAVGTGEQAEFAIGEVDLSLT